MKPDYLFIASPVPFPGERCIIKTCLPTINSISTMIRHDIVGVRKEKVILIAPGFIDDFTR